MGQLTSGSKKDLNLTNPLVTCPSSLISKQNVQEIEINGTAIKALIDTGSQVSLISNSLYEDH